MRSVGRYVKAFYVKAYEDNLTGLSGMVAYNLLLSILPLALVALFIASRILDSPDLARGVVTDLRQLFPTATETSLTGTLNRVVDLSSQIGVAALISSIWFGSSFWGAMDTAFCRIYDLRCRSWLEQKRFALVMLVVVLAFIAATLAVPAVQSLLISGARELPFGLSGVDGLLYWLTLAVGLLLLFVILVIIYWAVPNSLVPWRAVWPGALGATLAIGVIDYSYPFYLSQVTTLARLGTTLVFILIVLLWFYAVAIIILGGATLNALRFGPRDDGEAGDRGQPAAGEA